MRRHRYYVALGSVLGMSILLLGIFMWGGHIDMSAALAEEGAVVRVAPHQLGHQDVVVAITGTNMSNLGGFEFDLSLDPTVAQVTGARLGDFLARSGRTVGHLGPIVGSQGEAIAFGGYSYDPTGNNAPGSSGDGPLAYITMTVSGDGVSPLALQNVIVADVNASQQSVQVADASLQVRTLHSGWNLIAPCVDTRGWGVLSTLASLVGDFDLVLGERGSYVVGLPDTFQTLDEVVPPWSYYVRVTAHHAVTLTQVAGTISVSAPITLSHGWRWVGYCGGTPLPVSQALQSISGKYDLVIGEGGTYVVGLPDTFQTLQQMRQGEGYLIRMTGDGTLVYPSGGSTPRVPAEDNERELTALSGGWCNVQNTPYMTLVYGEVRVDGQPASVGTRVEAITPRGEVAGCFEVRTAGYFGLVQVYGADEKGGIPGFKAGEPIRWRVNGMPATATPQVTWQDDKAVHEVVLEVNGAASTPTLQRFFVPWLLK